jgi:hypothetical protein
MTPLWRRYEIRRRWKGSWRSGERNVIVLGPIASIGAVASSPVNACRSSAARVSTVARASTWSVVCSST